ncbi:MAG TPA: hypothetical protein VF042_09305 [Gemmatimonadaceae bacterium]
MKKVLFALGLVVATAGPLAAQSRSGDGPWWDPANTGNRGTVDTRDGRIYNDGRIYDSRNTDGQWRRVGRDNYGNTIYVRNRYDREGNLIQERARRDSRGRYQVIDRRVVRYASNRNGRYDRDGRYDNDNRYGRGKNDRWDQNNGHDNGKHNGQYKNKNKGRGRNH